MYMYIYIYDSVSVKKTYGKKEKAHHQDHVLVCLSQAHPVHGILTRLLRRKWLNKAKPCEPSYNVHRERCYTAQPRVL